MIVSKLFTSLFDDDMPLWHLFTEEITFFYPRAQHEGNRPLDPLGDSNCSPFITLGRCITPEWKLYNPIVPLRVVQLIKLLVLMPRGNLIQKAWFSKVLHSKLLKKTGPNQDMLAGKWERQFHVISLNLCNNTLRQVLFPHFQI